VDSRLRKITIMTSPRRFPPPWQVEQIPGGFKVLDANGQALVYVTPNKPRQCEGHRLCNVATPAAFSTYGNSLYRLGWKQMEDAME